jgi:hypothetical protein
MRYQRYLSGLSNPGIHPDIFPVFVITGGNLLKQIPQPWPCPVSHICIHEQDMILFYRSKTGQQ